MEVNRKVIVGGIAALVAGMATFKVASHFDNDTYRGKVVTQYSVAQGKSGHQYRFTLELENGGQRTFVNRDSWVRGKVNSADLQGRLNEGSHVEIDTYGFRVPLLSGFENTLSVKPYTP